MAIPPVKKEPFNRYLEPDHSEALARVVSAVAVFDPVKTAIGYLVPWTGAWLANQIEIRDGDPLQTLMTQETKEAIRTAVNGLKAAAGIDQEVGIYTSLDYNCSYFGGTLSLSHPIISVPFSLLTKPAETVFHKQDQEPAEALPPHWIFSEDEAAFFIARGLSYIKSNDALLRIASKVLFIASLLFLFSFHITPLIGITLLLGAAALHIFSERYVHGRLDVSAIEILTAYFNGNQQRAIAAGISALQKLIAQNIERKEKKSWWTTFYLTPAGNNLLDLDHPWLTNREKRVREHYDVPAEPILAH